MASGALASARTNYIRIQRVPDEQLVSVTSYSAGWLKIGSLDELVSHEKEILERIAATRNGGNLYMANPFLLLADIGVDLSDQARQQMIAAEPHLSALSALPYNALKNSSDAQSIRFHVHGLISRRKL